MNYYTEFDNPIGKLRIIENGIGITNLEFVQINKHAPAGAIEKVTSILGEAVTQLSEYFSLKREIFDLPLHLQGTDFQMKVWKELLEIPYGRISTYLQVAEAVGNPKAARAVGMANNRNPIPIIVPCHRVIGSDGRLTGYAGGLNVKGKLLDLEINYRLSQLHSKK